MVRAVAEEQRYRQFRREMESEWESFSDYILANKFGLATTRSHPEGSKKMATTRSHPEGRKKMVD